MKKIIKIFLLMIVILPLLGAVGLTGGKNSGGCKKKKDKNTRVERGDVNVVRKGKQYTVYGEIKNKKSKWLSDVQVKISLFDENNKEISTKTTDVIGKNPRRIPNNGNSIKENVLRKGEKGVFKAEFSNIDLNTTSAVTRILSKKRNTKSLMAKGKLKIKKGKLKYRNRNIRGTIINRATIPLWNVKVYAVVKNSNDDIISFESDDNIGQTEDIEGVNRSNVLEAGDRYKFNINTKVSENRINIGSFRVWPTWKEEIPSPPSTPETLVITTTAQGQPLITWDDVSNDEDGFWIYKRKKKKNGTFTNKKKIHPPFKSDETEKLTLGKRSYTDKDVNSGKTYLYSVTSYKKVDKYLNQKILNSSFSSEVEFSVP